MHLVSGAVQQALALLADKQNGERITADEVKRLMNLTWQLSARRITRDGVRTILSIRRVFGQRVTPEADALLEEFEQAAYVEDPSLRGWIAGVEVDRLPRTAARTRKLWSTTVQAAAPEQECKPGGCQACGLCKRRGAERSTAVPVLTGSAASAAADDSPTVLLAG